MVNLQTIAALPVFLVALSSCLPDKQVPSITVRGEAMIQIPADSFSARFELFGAGEDQGQAIDDLNAQLEPLLEGLPRMDQLDELHIRTEEIELEAVYSDDCVEDLRYSEYPICPVRGYIASMELSVKGAPAGEAGNVLSLASEYSRGVGSVTGFFLQDPTASQDAVFEKAFRRARSSANQIALASGKQLGGIVNIRPDGVCSSFDPTVFPEDDDWRPDGDVMFAQAARVIVPPEPTVAISKELIVTFELRDVSPPADQE